MIDVIPNMAEAFEIGIWGRKASARTQRSRGVLPRSAHIAGKALRLPIRVSSFPAHGPRTMYLHNKALRRCRCARCPTKCPPVRMHMHVLTVNSAVSTLQGVARPQRASIYDKEAKVLSVGH